MRWSFQKKERTGNSIQLTLASVAVPAKFDVLDVNPSPIARNRQLGSAELLYFGNPRFSEVSVLLLSRMRDLLKTIYNLFALAIACSVIAAAISSRTQKKDAT